MTATLTQARNALAAQLAAQIPGLRATGTVPGQVNPPQAIVSPAPGSIIEFQAMNDVADYQLRVTLLVGAADEPDSQNLLDGYLSATGPSSVEQALGADPTLGGTVAYAVLTGEQGYGLLDWGALQYLGCHLLVTVAA
jgi:hypothetical protein